MAKQQIGEVAWKFWNFIPEIVGEGEDRGVRWKSVKFYLFHVFHWFFDSVEYSSRGTENLEEENLEVRLDKRDSLFAVRNKTWDRV